MKKVVRFLPIFSHISSGCLFISSSKRRLTVVLPSLPFHKAFVYAFRLFQIGTIFTGSSADYFFKHMEEVRHVFITQKQRYLLYGDIGFLKHLTGLFHLHLFNQFMRGQPAFFLNNPVSMGRA